MAEGFADQCGFDFFTGSVCGMQDTAVAMPAFAGQVVALFTVWLHLCIK